MDAHTRIPTASDPLAAIHAAWRAEVAAPGFRILAADQDVAAAANDTARRGCELWHDPVPTGQDGRGMTRLVCRACGRFYGYSHDWQETAPRARSTR